MMGFLKHENRISGDMKGEEFLDELREYQLPKISSSS
jgi:hypothetical protein